MLKYEFFAAHGARRLISSIHVALVEAADWNPIGNDSLVIKLVPNLVLLTVDDRDVSDGT
jgi:hypothetical protein